MTKDLQLLNTFMSNEFFTLKDFSILELLKEGAYGEVFKAFHTPSSTLFALKKFKTETLLTDDGLSTAFLREMSFLRAFPHSNIIQCRGVMEDAETYYLVLELAEKDLSQRIAESVPFLSPRKVIGQLLAALEHLHANHIVHRDIKPSNILCFGDDTVKLADFGLARQYSSTTPMCYSQNVVTLVYRAPELLTNDSPYSAEVDLWAAGCVMAELELGVPLFCAANDVELLNQICSLMERYQPEEVEDLRRRGRGASLEEEALRLRWETIFSRPSDDPWLSFLLGLLNIDPRQRLTATQARKHSWLNESNALGDP